MLSAPCPLCGKPSFLFWEELRLDSVKASSTTFRCTDDKILFLHPVPERNGFFPSDGLRLDLYGDDLQRYHLKREEDAADWVRWLKGRSSGDAGEPPSGPDLIAGKVVLDIGAVTGAFCKAASRHAAKVTGVEPSKSLRRFAAENGVDLVPDWKSFPDGSADLITLFHIFEEFAEPIEALKSLAKKLKPGGTIVISTLNSENILINPLRVPEYVTFHLHPARAIHWSAEAIVPALDQASIDAKVTPLQRYGLANNFHWLLRRCPGSTPELAEVLDDRLEAAYRASLARAGRSDMLWVLGSLRS